MRLIIIIIIMVTLARIKIVYLSLLCIRFKVERVRCFYFFNFYNYSGGRFYYCFYYIVEENRVIGEKFMV